ncbi:DUF3099 domain-containing protein [Nocardioides sp. GY 10113]|uniref:DUF3099 domain-containing protein n=1 Tax=Nocardioides sp. GY 10113 TaxID=2569761 RepID=UPI0010A7F007|nr:DUF3099 domain-containing protein [Nocardioides sp. GY 10113]TIC87788.1 DUF3099 domain-containing protein [Nocardioides sp. GY 10113]
MATAGAGPVRITTVGNDPRADLARRQRKYIFWMSVRSLCFIGAAFAGVAGINWLWPFLIAAAVILPYLAVVMANANDSRDSSLPLPDGRSGQRQLGGPSGS